MTIIDSILTNNPCYKAGKKITVKGLMLHSVGCPQPSAEAFVKNWNKASYNRACVHAFIDANNGNVYQTLPWNHRGWHCGASGNNTHIGVEMCEPSCIKYTKGTNFTCSNYQQAREQAKRTFESAVELFAMLCKQYNLDPVKKGVIVSHKEGHSLGIASNHGDPDHLWSPLGLPYTMDNFREAVKKKMDGSVPTPSPTPASTPASTSDGSYKVRITADTLRVRAGAGTSYKVVTTVKKGEVYTIVETKNNWGKLKSGAGWISLAYTVKV